MKVDFHVRKHIYLINIFAKSMSMSISVLFILAPQILHLVD